MIDDVNFHNHYAKRILRNKLWKSMLVAGATFLFISCLLSFNFKLNKSIVLALVKIKYLKDSVKVMSKKGRDNSSVGERNKKLFLEIKKRNSLIFQGVNFTAYNLPSSCWFKSISFDKGAYHLLGNCRLSSSIYTFADKLRSNKRFVSIRLVDVDYDDSNAFIINVSIDMEEDVAI